MDDLGVPPISANTHKITHRMGPPVDSVQLPKTSGEKNGRDITIVNGSCHGLKPTYMEVSINGRSPIAGWFISGKDDDWG